MLFNNTCATVSLSDVGCLRTLNEDVVRVVPEIGLLVVADGMGGHNAGDVASALAVDTVEASLRSALAGRHSDPETVRRALREAVAEADRRIHEAGNSDRNRHQMGATIACLVLHDDHAHLAHIGDTRIYLLRGRYLKLLTRDQSPNQVAADAGLISAAEVAASHNRHFVTNALGASGVDHVELKDFAVEPGDVFLVCSDGLNDMVDGADIEAALDALQDNLPMAAEQLVMMARDCGGHDNISVALARVDAPFPFSANALSPDHPSLLARLRSWLTRTPH